MGTRYDGLIALAIVAGLLLVFFLSVSPGGAGEAIGQAIAGIVRGYEMTRGAQ